MVRNDDDFLPSLQKGDYDGLIISPGPGSPLDIEYFGRNMEVIKDFGARLPILGICLGFQGIAAAFGAEIKRAELPTHGKTSRLKIIKDSPILQNIPEGIEVMRYHSLMIDANGPLPDSLLTIAETESGSLSVKSNGREIMAIQHTKYPIYGLQFHRKLRDRTGNIIATNFRDVIRSKTMTITDFLKQTVDGKLSVDEQKNYLKENPFPEAEEIAEAVDYLYSQMPEVPSLPGAIDICGTGGSGLARINISTISAFIVAGAGVKVAKHGNNAASGKFGSFDLLAALDIPINISAQELQLRFKEYNLAFLYAKSFHPAMRFFAPVRTELDQPSFFNILGPLLSPVRAQKQLIGTPKIEYARLIAGVAKLLKKERVVVAVGSDGLDEITLTGPTTIVELKDDEIKEYEITPSDFGVEISVSSEIDSDDPEDNIKIANDILAGKEKSRKTDLVLVNSAMAIFLAGKSDDLKHGYKLAKQSLDSGEAKRTMDNYRLPSVLGKIAARDKARDFSIDGELPSSNGKYSGGLIAEIKKRSPSEGEIDISLDIVEQAKAYELAGASAISILTEPEDFGGSFDDLRKVRQAVSLPILCKDFIFRKEHIDKAKSCGADMILLIANVLQYDKLDELYKYAKTADLQAVVEVHNKSELEKALKLRPEIVGVNSRNLHDFSLDSQLFEELSGQIPKGVIKVAESGIQNYTDIPADYDGALVGTVIMKHPFPKLKIKELIGKPIIKLCGIRSEADAELCEKLGVDLIGINFVPRSKRKVDLEEGKRIAAKCRDTITVGVFENQPPDEVNKVAKQTGIKALQLSGTETDLSEYELPIIKTIKAGQEKPAGAFMTIIDGAVPGSGQKINYGEVDNFEPSLIAGGVDIDTAQLLFESKKPLGVDTASGIETEGEVDPKKIKVFYELADAIVY